MKKNENIYVKLQIEKDQNSGDLMLNVNFDKAAPNFFPGKNEISWCPTIDEMDFVNEAFEMVATRGQSNQHINKVRRDKTPTNLEKKTNDPPKEPTESKDVTFEPEKTEDKESTSDQEQNGEAFIVQADEKTIVEKVLEQKKQNKW